MKLTISIETSGELLPVDIPGSLTLEDFQAYIHAETDIEPESQILTHQSKQLNIPGNKDKRVDELGLKNDEVLILTKKQLQTNSNSTLAEPLPQVSQTDQKIEQVRQMILNNYEGLKQVPQELASVIHDKDQFKQKYLEFQNNFLGHSGQNQQELLRLQQDPDNPENQKRILEIIQQEEINKNYDLAWELSPESFIMVDMLYINMKINGHKVKAFVDSGAQQTIISSRLAEECGISRLIDRRFKTMAQGVGTQMSEGTIHSVPVSIGDSNVDLPCTFQVLDTSVDVLFGLNMLRRYNCVIDLKRNLLLVGDTIETPFLPSSEIPKIASKAGTDDGKVKFGENIFNSDANKLGRLSSDSKHTDNNPNKAVKAARTAAGTAAVARNSPSTNHNQEDIARLVSLGFTRDQVIQALDACNGNADMAGALLFG